MKPSPNNEGIPARTALVRTAIEKELGGQDGFTLQPRIDKVLREVFRLGRAQQALFAYVDSFVKVFLTWVPEPGSEAMDAAVARSRGRHARLLKSAGQSMLENRNWRWRRR